MRVGGLSLPYALTVLRVTPSHGPWLIWPGRGAVSWGAVPRRAENVAECTEWNWSEADNRDLVVVLLEVAMIEVRWLYSSPLPCVAASMRGGCFWSAI